jgi:rare lipoprotein A (peptidoglycan hydrolase)
MGLKKGGQMNTVERWFRDIQCCPSCRARALIELGVVLAIAVSVCAVVWIFMPRPAFADTASYYTRESCAREGTSGIMANGKELRDGAFTGASWFYKFGTVLHVYNLRNGRMVTIKITDRGPAKRLVKKGRVIDLSLAAFSALAPISQGVIPVKIEVVR